MKQEITVPSVGESVTQGILASWLKPAGEQVEEGSDLFELETDKATVTVPAPASGALAITVAAGTEVTIGQVVGSIDTEAAQRTSAAAPPRPRPRPRRPRSCGRCSRRRPPLHARPPARLRPSPALRPLRACIRSPEPPRLPAEPQPAARRVPMTNLRKADRRTPRGGSARNRVPDDLQRGQSPEGRGPPQPVQGRVRAGSRGEARVHVFLREGVHARPRRDARRGCADRGRGDRLSRVHGHRRCCLDGPRAARSRHPGRRPAGLAALESAIADLAARARDRKILPDELVGGTFSITNGGVFGSLLSTPLLNYPQSAILGMHTIQRRPIAEEGPCGELVVDPANDVSCAHLRPPPDRREGSGDVPQAGERARGGSLAPVYRSVARDGSASRHGRVADGREADSEARARASAAPRRR